jgi:hypothetical protein
MQPAFAAYTTSVGVGLAEEVRFEVVVYRLVNVIAKWLMVTAKAKSTAKAGPSIPPLAVRLREASLGMTLLGG